MMKPSNSRPQQRDEWVQVELGLPMFQARETQVEVCIVQQRL